MFLVELMTLVGALPAATQATASSLPNNQHHCTKKKKKKKTEHQLKNSLMKRARIKSRIRKYQSCAQHACRMTRAPDDDAQLYPLMKKETFARDVVRASNTRRKEEKQARNVSRRGLYFFPLCLSLTFHLARKFDANPSFDVSWFNQSNIMRIRYSRYQSTFGAREELTCCGTRRQTWTWPSLCNICIRHTCDLQIRICAGARETISDTSESCSLHCETSYLRWMMLKDQRSLLMSVNERNPIEYVYVIHARVISERV